jgi:hypothetical protein
MSQENVEVVRRAVAAVNRRDIDGYLACCTDDVQLSTPVAAVAGVYEGADGIRRFFADVDDAGPDFRLTIERVEAIGRDRVLTFMLVTATGRASGIPQDARTGTSMSSLAARSSASESLSTASKPSKPPGCGSRAAGRCPLSDVRSARVVQRREEPCAASAST